MSWSIVFGKLGSKDFATLRWALYTPSSITGYYFTNDSTGLLANCRFVDPLTLEVIICPQLHTDYLIEVLSPPTGEGFPNGYLTIMYESDLNKTLPNGPFFWYSTNPDTSQTTYFRAISAISTQGVKFNVWRKDLPDTITTITMFMDEYPFTCSACGCPAGYYCGTDENCIAIIPDPDEPGPPSGSNEPDPCQNVTVCGGKCYGSCDDQSECALVNGAYECRSLKNKPFWTQWWFWLVIILVLVILFALVYLLKRKSKKINRSVDQKSNNRPSLSNEDLLSTSNHKSPELTLSSKNT